MTDESILALFWQRSEDAIRATAQQYGRYLAQIAFHVLHQREDAEECVNDTYWTAWRQIPPDQPKALRTYLGRITRCHALNRFDYRTAQKRGGDFSLQLEELAQCLSDGETPESQYEASQVGAAISTFCVHRRRRPGGSLSSGIGIPTASRSWHGALASARAR